MNFYDIIISCLSSYLHLGKTIPEKTNIKDINDFKEFCRNNPEMTSLPHGMYVFIIDYMKMSSSKFGSEEHTKRKNDLIDTCAECTFSDEVDRITNLDSQYDRHYVYDAATVSPEYVLFLCSTPKYQEIILREGDTKILREYLMYIMDQEDNDYHFDLFEEIINRFYKFICDSIEIELYGLLYYLCKNAIEKNRHRYLKHIVENIRPLILSSSIHFLLLDKCFDISKSATTVDYIISQMKKDIISGKAFLSGEKIESLEDYLEYRETSNRVVLYL